MLRSRSTWACELKCVTIFRKDMRLCHAPRERVSWNIHLEIWLPKVKTSRSTWACELKYAVYLWWSWQIGSRSTWACELKYLLNHLHKIRSCHAPRERVSWNADILSECLNAGVTLHVSVWVEIFRNVFHLAMIMSRSTWACELKLLREKKMPTITTSRSTWACELK